MDRIALLLAVVLPACGGIVLAAASGASFLKRRATAVAFSLAAVASTTALFAAYRFADPVSISFEWLPWAGVRLGLTPDLPGMLLLLVCGALFPAALAARASEEQVRGAGWQASALFLQSATAGALLAANMRTMVFAAMAAAAPVFFMVFSGEGLRKQYAAHKAAIVILAASTPVVYVLVAPSSALGTGHAAHIHFFLPAFAPWALVMARGFPLHSWFASAAAEGPKPATALINAVTPCIAACACGRFVAPYYRWAAASAELSQFSSTFAWGLTAVFCAGIAYFTLLSIAERDRTKKIAYASCSATGIAMAGMASMQPMASAAGLILVLFESVFFGALFLLPERGAQRAGGAA